MAEEDLTANIGLPPCAVGNQDLMDDGAFVPPFTAPNQEINVQGNVAAKIDQFGFANRSPSGEDSRFSLTLQPDCGLARVPDIADTPTVHRDRGRYAAWDARRRLWLNVWADWDANGVWADAEKVIAGPIDPESWGPDGAYTLGEPFVDADNNGVRTSGEAFTDVAGNNARQFNCTVTVPKNVNLKRLYYWRFRLDYGENVMTNNVVVHHAEEDGRVLNQVFGGALWGEVEDTIQQAGELDEFKETEVRMTIEGPFGDQRVTLRGPTTIWVDIGNVADTDSNGREEVQAEILSMNLTGSSTIGPINARLRPADKRPFLRTLGVIEENVNATPGVLDVPPFTSAGTASSFFEVYFEIEVMNMLLHNEVPKRMESTITHKPPRDRDRSPDFIDLLDENGNVTGIRMGGASHIPVADDEAKNLEGFINDLSAQDVFTRIEAAIEIAGFGELGLEALPNLIEALADEDARVRLAAVQTLGSFGPAAAEATAALQVALEDPDEAVRAAAAEALENIGGN